MTVVPFPRARNRTYVAKHAKRMAQLPEPTAEMYLEHQIEIQARTMSRRGIAGTMICREKRALRTAIRAELRRLKRSGGVA